MVLGNWVRRIRLSAAHCMAGVLFFTQAALAQSTDSEFEARVREYLLSNPEVIVEALHILSERERKDAVLAKLKSYKDHFDAPPALGLGAPDAPIRVIEFFDYKCAPCKAMHADLKAAVAANPNLRLEMKQLPILSPGSERAARFALAVKGVAGTDPYHKVHEQLWAMSGPLRNSAFKALALEQGLDWMQVETAMNSAMVSDQIARNRDMAIDLGIFGTPAFVTLSSISFGQQDVEGLIASWLSQ